MRQKKFYNILIICGVVFFLGTALFVFKTYSPEESTYFPKCPSKYLTGYDCPGCGTQRALHASLNGDFKKAFDYNPLLLFLLPLIILIGSFEWIPKLRKHPFRRTLNNKYFIISVFFIIIGYTIWRNL